MFLQNLLKKFSDLWHHGKSKISVVKSDVFPKHKDDYFIYRNKREIIIIFASLLIVLFCAASITHHAVKSGQPWSCFRADERRKEKLQFPRTV